MLWTLLALILLIVLGGFISYYGDLQGRRWGKKRVSWFGLRPKYTAILITSLTGSSIALLSVAFLMLVVPQVRDVVLSGEAAIRENKGLISQQKQDYRTYTLSLKQVSQQVSEKTQQLTETIRRQAELDRKIARLTQEITTRTKQYDAVERQYRLLVTQSALLNRQIQLARNVNANLKHENKELATINRDIGLTNKELGTQNYALARDNYNLTRTNTDLQISNTNLKQQRDKNKADGDALYDASVEKAKEVAELNRQVNELTQQRDEVLALIRQRDELYSQIEGANHTIAQANASLRQGRVTLRTEGELARRIIGPHLNEATVHQELMALLKDAEAAARKLGAGTGTDGRVVRVVDKPIITLTGRQNADEEMVLSALTERLTERDQPVVVVANASSNSLVGETVLVKLQSYTVERVYVKGDLVASQRINGRQPVGRIIEDLIAFLQTDARDSAIKAGTIPKVDPQTGTREVGIVGAADLFDLTERVRKMGGDVLLTATAKSDLSSADPLNLNFKVTRDNHGYDDTMAAFRSEHGPRHSKR